VGGARELDEPGARDEIGEELPVGRRNHHVLPAVHDERGRSYIREAVVRIVA
jgi:hypothetical protein